MARLTIIVALKTRRAFKVGIMEHQARPGKKDAWRQRELASAS